MQALGLHFLLSDGVSTSLEVFESGRLDDQAVNIAQGSLTMAPSHLVLRHFQTFLNDLYRDVKNGVVVDDVIKAYVDVRGACVFGLVLFESECRFALSSFKAFYIMVADTRVFGCSGVFPKFLMICIYIM